MTGVPVEVALTGTNHAHRETSEARG
jgi:hypothetical protein